MNDPVIADQQPIGLAARHAEFGFVDLLEQLALVELDRPLQVAAQLDPADIHNLDHDP